MTSMSLEEFERECTAACRYAGKTYIGVLNSFAGHRSKFIAWCDLHQSYHAVLFSNRRRSYLCNQCGYFALQNKTEGDIVSTFSGFSDGTRFEKSERKRYWNVWCPECSNDEYSKAGVSPKFFTAHASSLQKGCKPCRCGKNYRWTAGEREYLIKKLCSDSKIEFLGWAEGHAPGRSLSSIRLFCLDHGEFTAKASDFIHDENRCPDCAIPGFRYSIPGYVYVLKSDCSAYMKVGISNYPDSRIKSLRLATPFSFEIKRIFSMDGRKAREIEKQVHSHFESAGLYGFDGYTEWIKSNDEIIEFIEKRAS